MNPDVAVIGGGLVGSAIAYGLSTQNVRVVVLDGSDRDLRASAANVGLVWLQGKGLVRKQDRAAFSEHLEFDRPAYQLLTRESVELWSTFSRQIAEETSIDVQYDQKGGLSLCMSEAEFEARHADLLRWHNQLGGDVLDWEMLDRRAVADLLPDVKLGPEVVGASFGHRDGQANPLRLLAALHAGILSRGGRLLTGKAVDAIESNIGGGYTIRFGDQRLSAGKIVIAAGLGSRTLGATVGLDVPVRPQRGQVLVTERLEPFLPMPLHGVRQTREGTIMIGSTYEEAGFDPSTTVQAAATLSAKAIRQLPQLSDAKLVRQWAGLRIMTPDGHPIYAQSESHPGVFVALCHSGVTLAAVHVLRLASAIASGTLPSSFDPFHYRRFDVSEAA